MIGGLIFLYQFMKEMDTSRPVTAGCRAVVVAVWFLTAAGCVSLYVMATVPTAGVSSLLGYSRQILWSSRDTHSQSEGTVDVHLSQSQDVCSPEVFRRHYEVHGYFPSGGRWSKENQTTYFIPDICKFRWRSIPGETLSKCLVVKNITSIVTLGASQAGRYTEMLIENIQKTFPVCKRLKMENQTDRVPDESYFADGDMELLKNLQTRPHHCSGCNGVKTICYSEDRSHNVTIERLGMDDLIDSTLRLYIRHARERSIETYQEFLFKNYLARNPPDLIIISPAMNHAKFKSSPAKFAADVTHFRSLMQIYLPRSTRTVWIPGMSEHEDAKHRKSAYKNRRQDGLSATESIDRLNHVLYGILEKDLLDPDSGVLAFLDLVQASRNCASAWWNKKDGVHLDMAWYGRVMSDLLEFFCSE